MQLRNKRVTLVGMGRSSVAAAQLLLREGAYPFISELRTKDQVAPWRNLCRDQFIPYETGGHTADRFLEADMLVLSPGVPLATPLVAQAAERGVPITGELELASHFCESRYLAVTGTNGKTTVTELLRAMIAAGGHTVALAGNNDRPLSLVALEPIHPAYVVLEVSSYQLETVSTLHPCAAAVLNVTPDHLGRHKTMEGYADTKAKIFARQGAGDVAVINLDDPFVRNMPIPEGVSRCPFSMTERPENGIWADDEYIYYQGKIYATRRDNPLPGKHNLANVLAAIGMLASSSFEQEGILTGLSSFQGVEHRIEYVLTLDGVDYYNDSKATNIDSLRVALESFDRPLVLIAGGQGKDGADYRELRPLVAGHVGHLIAMGQDGPAFVEALGDLTPYTCVSDMAQAVKRAQTVARPGNIVLLSSGCASFDQYNNFEERGRHFKTLVRALGDGDAPSGAFRS